MFTASTFLAAVPKNISRSFPHFFLHLIKPKRRIIYPNIWVQNLICLSSRNILQWLSFAHKNWRDSDIDSWYLYWLCCEVWIYVNISNNIFFLSKCYRRNSNRLRNLICLYQCIIPMRFSQQVFLDIKLSMYEALMEKKYVDEFLYHYRWIFVLIEILISLNYAEIFFYKDQKTFMLINKSCWSFIKW